jgi:hypothetical protein
MKPQMDADGTIIKQFNCFYRRASAVIIFLNCDLLIPAPSRAVCVKKSCNPAGSADLIFNLVV